MRWQEQIKKDREVFRTLPDQSSKINFIWDYYRIPIIAFLCLLAVCGLILHGMTGGSAALYAVLVNSDARALDADETVFAELLETSGMDIRGKKISVNTDYTLGEAHNETADAETMQVLNALFMISDLDVCSMPEMYFDQFARAGGFADLSMLIPEKTLQEHSEDFYFYTDEEGNTHPVGLILGTDSPLHQAGYYHEEVILGMAVHAQNYEAGAALIQALVRDRN